MKLRVEVTDTYAGEANYSWAKRFTLDVVDQSSDLALVRRVKREISWSNKRCSVYKTGDCIELRPYGECQVAFVTWG